MDIFITQVLLSILTSKDVVFHAVCEAATLNAELSFSSSPHFSPCDTSFLTDFFTVPTRFPPVFNTVSVQGLQLLPLCIPDTESRAWCIKTIFIQTITVCLNESMRKGLHITA